MSDWIEHGGKKYYEESYVKMLLETIRRRDTQQGALAGDVARLGGENANLRSQRNAAMEGERQLCTRALTALAGAGIPTPEATYGSSTPWAISDLCRAVAEVTESNRRGYEALKEFTIWHGAAHEAGCPADDTCTCRGRLVNHAVDEFLAEGMKKYE